MMSPTTTTTDQPTDRPIDRSPNWFPFRPDSEIPIGRTWTDLDGQKNGARSIVKEGDSSTAVTDTDADVYSKLALV